MVLLTYYQVVNNPMLLYTKIIDGEKFYVAEYDGCKIESTDFNNTLSCMLKNIFFIHGHSLKGY